MKKPKIDKYDGTKHWYNEAGKWHRLDGPAIEWANGTKEWWANGKRHRIDGPAYEESTGHKEWWVNGERHRTDGPAYEGLNGYKEWWFHGVRAENEERFWDKRWRTKIMLKRMVK